MNWKRLDRKTLVDTKFLKVYEDKIKLPNGNVVDDYTVVEKPDYVVIIATDESGNIISLREYKYAIGEKVNTLPGGHVIKSELLLESAKRELLEETGYTANDWQELGYFYDYASKDCHKAYFVKATNARKTDDAKYEITESIDVRVIPITQLKKEVMNGEWKTNVALAGLVMAGIYS